jgi:hypothetical protein
MPASRPYGLLLLALAAVVLLVLLLDSALYKSTGGSESQISQAIETLFIIAGLWFVLLVMLLIAVLGEAMPPWVPWLALVLVPMAAVAHAVAVDMCGRHMEWAVAIVAALPALIIFYALWARLPRLRAALPAERTSTVVWGAVFFLSAVTFVIAAY